MSTFGWKRKPRTFDPASPLPFTISRSRIDLFVECPRCFYLDRRLGVSRPSMPSFTLNNAVDTLLKNEFDLLRKNGEAHELMKQYGIDAVPFKHPEFHLWRDDVRKYEGASILYKPVNFIVCGIIDDIWINHREELLVVDYKATSTTYAISLEDKYKQGYKRQMEVYQWIFRQKGFTVADVGYFVFANAGRNRPKFDGRLEFELSIIPHRGDTTWIEPTLKEIKKVLMSDTLPPPKESCEHCNYRASSKSSEGLF